MTIAERVLDLARFAPSGDNSQPWRFVLRAPDRFDVYGYDTRSHCVYDLDGWASQFAHGMLLETIAIAASHHGRRARIEAPVSEGQGAIRYAVALDENGEHADRDLANAITSRTVQRGPMSSRPLLASEMAALESAVAPLRIVWFSSLSSRARVAALCMRNARIRLTIPEAYAVHRSVIAWRATTSEDRMPDASLGAPAPLLATMRYAMVSWERVERTNRWTGTLLPRLALDFVPGLRCSAQFALIANREPLTLEERLLAGRAVQRLWLTAESLGLQTQPQYTPLVFARYARERRRFTEVERALRDARESASRLADLLGADATSAVWLARIGARRPVAGRSLRLPLAELIVDEPPREYPQRAARSTTSCRA